jgi:hypothetical protein
MSAYPLRVLKVHEPIDRRSAAQACSATKT